MADHADKPYGGEYPDVKDEAANSPKWLPALGFAILCVLALFLAVRAGTAHEEAAPVEGASDPTAEVGEADPAPDLEAAAEGPE